MNSRIANSRLDPSTAVALLDLNGEIDEEARDRESPEGRMRMGPGRERGSREDSREDRMRVQTGNGTGKAISKDNNRGDSLADRMKTDLVGKRSTR